MQWVWCRAGICIAMSSQVVPTCYPTCCWPWLTRPTWKQRLAAVWKLTNSGKKGEPRA